MANSILSPDELNTLVSSTLKKSLSDVLPRLSQAFQTPHSSGSVGLTGMDWKQVESRVMTQEPEAILSKADLVGLRYSHGLSVKNIDCNTSTVSDGSGSIDLKKLDEFITQTVEVKKRGQETSAEAREGLRTSLYSTVQVLKNSKGKSQCPTSKPTRASLDT